MPAITSARLLYKVTGNDHFSGSVGLYEIQLVNGTPSLRSPVSHILYLQSSLTRFSLSMLLITTVSFILKIPPTHCSTHQLFTASRYDRGKRTDGALYAIYTLFQEKALSLFQKTKSRQWSEYNTDTVSISACGDVTLGSKSTIQSPLAKLADTWLHIRTMACFSRLHNQDSLLFRLMTNSPYLLETNFDFAD